MTTDTNQEIVQDEGQWKWSEMIKTEDWWSIWLGFLLLIIGMLLYFPSGSDHKQNLKNAKRTFHNQAHRTDKIKTIAWFQYNDARKKMKARNSVAGKWLSNLTLTPRKWSENPVDSFYMSEEKAEGKRRIASEQYERALSFEKVAFTRAIEAETLAEESRFKNPEQNTSAQEAIQRWRQTKLASDIAFKRSQVKAYNQLPWLLSLGIMLALFFGVGVYFMGESFKSFFVGFIYIFVISVVVWVFSNQLTMKNYGIGYAFWGIFIGMLISNTIGTPEWVKPAAKIEFYIKTGLVLLGSKILFEKVITIGSAGIFVAWVVTPTVWIVTYWFGQKILKMSSKRLNAVICSDMSVCGVAAAIATASACKAKKEELTLSIGLSLIFTAIMMILMPIAIKIFIPLDKQMVLGGAWLGGTIDATGAVAAAGAFLGEKALYVAATIKMIQNILIGVIAFFVATYFTTRVEAAEKGTKVSILEVWYRFPKFVLGFLGSSIMFSLIYTGFNDEISGLGSIMIDEGIVKGMSDLFRNWFFVLSFVSIGLETNFKALKSHFEGGKPLKLYVVGQALNLTLTLIVAYLAFYVFFPEVTAKI